MQEIEFELENVGTVNNYREYEVARNKEIIFELANDGIALSRILDTLDSSNLLQHSDRVMIERLKTSLSCGIDCKGILERLVELGKKSPSFLALVVSLAIYRHNNQRG
ncbi:MAG: hypothetical protein Q7S22_06900 [Candidatus Micrarchaeota archaeon]|nr:hypothetical protein [Candidatus Micrarchaeota archaeon]